MILVPRIPNFLDDKSIVGHWSFDYGQAIDSSPSKNNGTVVGATPYAGRLGTAMLFNGSTSQYIRIGTNGLPIGSSQRTVSLWFKLAANSSQEFLGYGQNIIGQRWGMFYNAGILYAEMVGISQAMFWAYDTNPHMFTAVLPDNASTCDKILLYLDAVPASSYITTNGSINTTTGSDGQFIGGLPLGGNPFPSYSTNGYLDEVIIFNRAKSLGEIIALYNNTKSLIFSNNQVYRKNILFRRTGLLCSRAGSRQAQ